MTDAFDPPSETLPSRQAAINVTTDNEISEVRVAYDEELVYTKDKGFVAPYLTSALMGGKALNLVRTGGWPRAFDVHVEETAAAPSGGQKWGALYEVDFTTLPDQVIGAPGSYTIDGKTWWLKGNTSNSGGIVASGQMQHGNGFGIRSNFSQAVIGGFGADPQKFLTWFLPFSSLAGYEADAPIAVQFRLSSTSGAAPRTFLAGIADCTSDVVGITQTAAVNAGLVGGGGFDTVYSMLPQGAGPFAENVSSLGVALGSSPLESAQFMVVQPIRKLLFAYGAPWAGSFVDLASAPFVDNGSQNMKSQPGGQVNMGFLLAIHDNGGGTSDYLVKNLKISQPKALTP